MRARTRRRSCHGGGRWRGNGQCSAPAVGGPPRGPRHPPGGSLRGQIHGAVIPVAESTECQIALERVETGRQVLAAVRIELHAEQRSRVALDEGTAEAFENWALPGV